MQTPSTSVVSAAVISGDLIIGLSDGSIINCGRVQGPQGLTGDQGPMGATGRSGTDGNTIHTVQGTPDTTVGKDGDFAINVALWEIYGPRAGGAWGTGTPLRGNKRGDRQSKDPLFGMGSGSEDSGGGRAYNTANLPLAGTGRAITAPGGNIIPIGNDLTFQSNLNRWVVDSLTALDEAIPISVGDVLPNEGDYQGDMVLVGTSLHVWNGAKWVEISGEPGKESQPYIDFSQFKVIERSDRFDYDPLFSVNPIATYSWRYEIDLTGNGNFVDVTVLSDGVKNDIGWYGSISETHLRLKKTTEQTRLYPDAKVRFWVESSLNSVNNEEGTCELLAWENNECNYALDLLTLEQRVAIGESKQENIIDEIGNALIIQDDLLGRVTSGETAQTEIQNTVDTALGVQNDLLARVQAGEAEQQRIKLDIEELGITKGSVARYKITATNIGAAGRNGELYVNNAAAADVQAMSFAPFDLNGQPTKPCNVGDIVELVQAAALANVGEVSRYRILSGDSNALTVEYLSGTNDFEVDQTQEVYIYPQNEEGVSKEYVDAQDELLVKKSGDTMDPNSYLKFASGGLIFNTVSDVRQSVLYEANENLTQWTAYNGKSIKITARDGDPGGGRTYIDVRTADSSGTAGEDDGYRMKLYHVATPTSDFDAANKKYVDNAVSNSGGGTAGITLNLWTYRGSKSSSSGLNDGEFGSRMLSGNVLELYLAGNNSQGKIYHPTNTNNAIFEYSHQITNSGQAGSPLTVMHKDGRCMWYAETKKIIFNKGNVSGVMIEAVQFRAAVNLLTEGDQYMLNVAGFLSPVSGWS